MGWEGAEGEGRRKDKGRQERGGERTYGMGKGKRKDGVGQKERKNEHTDLIKL